MRITYKEIKHPNFMILWQGTAKIGNKKYSFTGESKEDVKRAFTNLLKVSKQNYAVL